jgi:hypothetical protein
LARQGVVYYRGVSGSNCCHPLLMARCGLVRLAKARRGAVRAGCDWVRRGRVWHGGLGCGAVWRGTARSGEAGQGMGFIRE